MPVHLLHAFRWVLAMVLSFGAPALGRASGPTAAETPQGELTPASLVLIWNHQAQFAGYYMALEKGFYKQAGIDLEIRRGGPDIVSCDEVTEGRAEFCVAMLATALDRRIQGQPLVLLSQVVNRSNFVLVAWKHPPGAPEAALEQFADLSGRRVSIWEADLRLPYLSAFAQNDVHPEIVPQYYAPSLFYHRGVDACAAMRYNEYDQLLQHGVRPDEVVVFNLWEQGVVLPEDGLYTRERTWRDRPDLCRAFAQASLEGWIYARDHTEETLSVVMRYVDADNVPTNRPHMRWMLNEILRSVFPEQGDGWEFGTLSPFAFAEAVKVLPGSEAGDVPEFEDFVIPEARDDIQ